MSFLSKVPKDCVLELVYTLSDPLEVLPLLAHPLATTVFSTHTSLNLVSNCSADHGSGEPDRQTRNVPAPQLNTLPERRVERGGVALALPPRPPLKSTHKPHLTWNI